MDRTQDRHRTSSYPYRPRPADLLDRLDAAVGRGQRARVISVLLVRFLAGDPMPQVDQLARVPRRRRRGVK